MSYHLVLPFPVYYRAGEPPSDTCLPPPPLSAGPAAARWQGTSSPAPTGEYIHLDTPCLKTQQ